ncbi:MAG: hypothetical protein AAGD92_13180 [Pseudomonadota bacterium]
MNRRDFLATATATTAFLAAKPVFSQGNNKVGSVSRMIFAPDDRLIIADWKRGMLHALALPKAEAAPSASFNVRDLDGVIARAEGIDRSVVKPAAFVFQASKGLAVIAYRAGRGPDAPTRLAIIATNGATNLIDPASLVEDSTALPDSAPNAQLWNRTPARSLLVTDMTFHESSLFVAGVANADFSSTLYKFAYPFEEAVAATQIEMYHTVHNQIETRAPIRAMSIVRLNDRPHLLGAYTCTPLVTVPLDTLEDGAVIRAKTIAELGFGNTPLDIIPFQIEHQGQTSDWVIVANAAKSADLIPLDAIAAASKAPSLSSPVQVPFETTAGPSAVQLPLTNLAGMVDQDGQFLLTLRRDPASGGLELMSVRKGAFFRLSDFINEYDFPNYQYPEDSEFQQQYIRPFHGLMKTDEGHADLIK